MVRTATRCFSSAESSDRKEEIRAAILQIQEECDENSKKRTATIMKDGGEITAETAATSPLNAFTEKEYVVVK